MSAHPYPEKTYSVPQRFGLKTLLVVPALFGLLFAAAQWAAVPYFALVFYACFMAFVYMAQMLFAKAPRAVSIAAGSLFMPLAILALVASPWGPQGSFEQILPRINADNPWLWLIVIGGFLGYLAGTILAAVYMVFDQLGSGLGRLRGARGNPHRHGSAGPPGLTDEAAGISLGEPARRPPGNPSGDER